LEADAFLKESGGEMSARGPLGMLLDPRLVFGKAKIVLRVKKRYVVM
jgi:hypothetical protein